MIIDLHGYTIHNAWDRFRIFIIDAHQAGHRRVSVVTGQGAIMRELPEWAHVNDLVQSCSSTAHNPGRFELQLRKKG